MFLHIPELDQLTSGDVTITVEEGDGFAAVFLLDDDAMARYAASKIFPKAQEATMNTLTPGTRVDDNGKTGTVVVDPKTAEHPGFIPVAWDDGSRTLAHPSILTELNEDLHEPVTRTQAIVLGEFIHSLAKHHEPGALAVEIYACRGTQTISDLVAQLKALPLRLDAELRATRKDAR